MCFPRLQAKLASRWNIFEVQYLFVMQLIKTLTIETIMGVLKTYTSTDF